MELDLKQDTSTQMSPLSVSTQFTPLHYLCVMHVLNPVIHPVKIRSYITPPYLDTLHHHHEIQPPNSHYPTPPSPWHVLPKPLSPPLTNNSQSSSTSTPPPEQMDTQTPPPSQPPQPQPPQPQPPQPQPPQPLLTTGGRTVLSTTALINQRKGIFAHKHRHSTAHLQALGALRSILIPPKEDTVPPTPPTLSSPPNKQEPTSNKDIKEPSYTEKQYESKPRPHSSQLPLSVSLCNVKNVVLY
jgi:hypothetical protein